ncbi:uncharacterized protein LOC131850050 [Achroia grisella]|uniref:uncharacterized protein LOC131850050 n=1 Tax=Achroia grisella TaxID=688607 RepID=UPI0027D34632|nr:uncharacterized protein LOC131850050 [Achroia grisella]
MEAILQPPQPFRFENNLLNVTSGNVSKEWEKWKKAFLVYFEACELNKKEKRVQINILLHIIGEKCREIYEQFSGEYKTVDDVLKQFDEVFLPRKNLTVERHIFFTRDQEEMESIEQYVFELNKMAAKCEFKDLCSDLVRDRLICGIRNGAIRERLLREPDLTLSKAVDVCKLAELSRVQATNIKTENTEYNVHEINNGLQGMKHNEALMLNRIKNRRSGMKHHAGADGKTINERRDRRFERDSYQRRDLRNQSSSSGRQQRQRHMNVRKNANGCGKCGGIQGWNECPAFGHRCYNCSKMNHYSRMCRVYAIQEASSDQADESHVMAVKNMPTPKNQKDVERFLGLATYVIAPVVADLSISHSRDHLAAQAQVCCIAASNPLTDTIFLQIQQNTKNDQTLQKLIKVIKNGSSRYDTHSSGAPMHQLNSNSRSITNYCTRYDREVRAPDRWGYSTPGAPLKSP